MIVTSSYLYDFFILILTGVVVATLYIKYRFGYWKRKGVPQLPPSFPLGNYPIALPKGISIGGTTKKYYDEFKASGFKLGGIYLGLTPYIVIADASYAKDVLTKDFQHFVDRGVFMNKKDPITSNIFTQGGNEWRDSRAKFTSMFTSVKMKFFYDTMKKCSDDLGENLKTLADNHSDVDIYEMMGCYTTDVIGSVVFGVEANSFKQPDATFRKMGRDIFEAFSLPFQLNTLLTICYPSVARKVQVTNLQNHILEFAKSVMKDSVEYREKNKVQRSDFLQLLIEMKRSGVTLSLEEMTSQALLFFTAGFETSSSSASLALYELGLHQDIQEKVRAEIITVLNKHNGEISYEAIKEMSFLTQVFNETVRKYPPLPTLNRVCVKDYTFEHSDVTIEKGTDVLIPVLGYCRDPDYFPDPLKWDPDRFEDKNEKHEGFLPFGDGPRNCIGARFGIMQVKLGLISVIRNFEVTVSPNTSVPVEFEELTFVTRTTQPVFLRLKKIN